MIRRYAELIDQTFDFPQTNFGVQDGYLQFHQVPLKSLIDTYGAPLKITYLPSISQQITKARQLFHAAMTKANYAGKYHYCYCTKSSHFRFVLERVRTLGVPLEISSTFDARLVHKLYDSGQVDKHTLILANGYKAYDYALEISHMINKGFNQLIPICDHPEELTVYEQNITQATCPLGLRIAIEEEALSDFYISRLGMRAADALTLYKERIAPNPRFQLRMLHFFMNTGIKDSEHYWNELRKIMQLYGEMKKICPELTGLNIGGGLPIQNSLSFEYDYAYMIEEIVRQIKQACEEYGVPEPDIYTEFGKYTVGESSAIIFSRTRTKTAKRSRTLVHDRQFPHHYPT